MMKHWAALICTATYDIDLLAPARLLAVQCAGSSKQCNTLGFVPRVQLQASATRHLSAALPLVAAPRCRLSRTFAAAKSNSN